ncbi:MAG: lipase maturation factor family protein, partial [Bdellovibrionales bacterium]|nr:lipase maturation factor family protein [Bdellovibrionales bacterium]
KNVISPIKVSWALYQLPHWVQIVFTHSTFVLELVLPFLIFLGRKSRVAVFSIFVFFQVILFFSVSFSHLHITYSAICLYLLVDRDLLFLEKSLSYLKEPIKAISDTSLVRKNIAVLIVILCGVPVLAMHYNPSNVVFVSPHFVYKRQKKDIPILWYLQFLYNYRISSIVSRFRFLPLNGKFIIIEGSYDKENWERIKLQDYLDDENEAPMWITPGMNVVSKQLYFSSHNIDEGANNNMISHYSRHWLQSLKKHLISGTPEVYKLFEPTKFSEKPPKYLRYRLATFSFTNFEELRKTGQWLKVDSVERYSIPKRNWSY